MSGTVDLTDSAILTAAAPKISDQAHTREKSATMRVWTPITKKVLACIHF